MTLPFAPPHRPAALALLALLLAAGPALAHRTWLLPSATAITGKEGLVSVDGAVSEDLFEFDTNALQAEEVAVTAPDGSPGAAENRSTARRRTSFDVKLAQPGTYRIAAVSETAFVTYRQGSEPRRWRGPLAGLQALARELPADAQDLRVTHMQARVETFVTLDRGDERALAKAFAPVGKGLELQPLTVPTDLSVGDQSRFRVLLDGQPLAGADVTVLRGGNRYRYKMGELVLKTDAQGLFTVSWPEAGRYWIGLTHGRRPGPDASAAERGTPTRPVRRASYSATVEVLPQ